MIPAFLSSSATAFVVLIAPGSVAPAQPVADAEKKDEKWDVTAPRGATIRQVPIRTDQGTWMDVDVSPDGGRLAFSLLGDIYTMPITGGTPTVCPPTVIGGGVKATGGG